MTTPTETGLLRYAVVDGKTFIVDAEGRTLGQVVPFTPTDAMLLAGHSKENEGAWGIYRAMRFAATVDLTGAVVKVPERLIYDTAEPLSVRFRKVGWNEVIDALERK